MGNGPEFWIVAGPNGAGKTTCCQRKPISLLLRHVNFLNPDDLTKQKLNSAGYRGFTNAPTDIQTRLFFASADEVQLQLEASIEASQTVGVETVLSSDKYRELVNRVHERNGVFRLVYVALKSSAIAMKRVAIRVSNGGHGIPDDKIDARFHRSLQNLTWFASRAHSFWVLDNSENDPSRLPIMIAFGSQGRVDSISDDAFPEMKTALAPLV